MLDMLLSNFSVACVVSFIWAAFGFAVAKVKNDETFVPQKFLKTLILGLMLSIISTLADVNIATLENAGFAMVLVVLIDKFAGMIMEKE